jgi:hypothetical protein
MKNKIISVFSWLPLLLLVSLHSYAQENDPAQKNPALADSLTKDSLPQQTKKKQSLIAHSVAYTLIVGTKEEATEQILALSEKQLGYLLEMNDYQLVLKIPGKNFETFCDALEKIGVVAAKNSSSGDDYEEWFRKAHELNTKRKLLQDYFDILENAQNSSTLLSVEREILSLTYEIERLSGAKKLLEHNAAYADVRIAFQYRDRSGPKNHAATSVFPWVNKLDVRNLMQDFNYEHK